MKTSGLIIAYIGTPDSYFSKIFLPKLQELSFEELKFISVRQNEFIISPPKASQFLKLVLQIKKLKHFINNLSSSIYWSVYCQQHHIQLMQTNDINTEQIKSVLQDCDFVLSAGIRSKFNPEILVAPKNGIINFHYSLLPKYRGTNPVFWQKVNQDLNFGYTFHLMNEHIDRGDILLQNQISVKSDKSVSQICDFLTDHASNQLDHLVHNLPQEKSQDEKLASEFTNSDYSDYITIKSSEHGSIWFEKCGFTSLFILNERWMVHLEKCEKVNQPNKFSMNGSFIKDGYHFKFKKINYLPPLFYYLSLRNYFE